MNNKMSCIGCDSSEYCPIVAPKRDNLRFSLFPIKLHQFWDLYKQQEGNFWRSNEIDMTTDRVDFEKLTANEKHYIETILAFFSWGDGFINEQIFENFSKEFEEPEIRAFYAAQSFIEIVHQESYGLMIESLVSDKKRQIELYTAVKTHPGSIAKVKWIESFAGAPLLERLVVFACLEGIFFTSAFAAIFWLKKRGLMEGLGFANKKISQDEGLHATFACAVFKYKNGIAKDYEGILKAAVEIEHDFLKEAIPVGLIGLNADLMYLHVQFIANGIYKMLGGKNQLYPVNESPFDFMDNCWLETLENFFETAVSNYQMSGGAGSTFDFNLDEDF